MEHTNDQHALAKAAKYVCTIKCGSCPMVVERFPCPVECTQQTMPWHCWLVYFKKQQKNDQVVKT